MVRMEEPRGHQVTKPFVKWTEKQDTPLTATGPWCMRVGRWKEAYEANKADSSSVEVPKVYLNSTNVPIAVHLTERGKGENWRTSATMSFCKLYGMECQ